MSATYREARLPASAGDVAEAVWTVHVRVATSDWLVLPDGCVDVVLIPGASPLVAGPMTAPSCLAYPAGAQAAGLRLRPGAAAALLRVGAEELVDALVPLEALGRTGRSLALDRAQDAIDHGDALGAVDGLRRALRAFELTRHPDPVCRRATELLRHDPSLPIGAICRTLSISERQLRRRFAHHVGYGPKRFARTMRLQSFLRLQRRHPAARLAELAARAGYADQAHLVHDCRELAGRPPGRLLAQRAAVRIEDGDL